MKPLAINVNYDMEFLSSHVEALELINSNVLAQYQKKKVAEIIKKLKIAKSPYSHTHG